LVPSCFCTVLIIVQLLKRPSMELFVSLSVLLALITIVLFTLSSFHDILFYYIITAVLGFLFIQQALKLNKEQNQRKLEQQQIAKLQFKLEQNQQQQQPQKISINSAGKVERVPSEQIAYCKAAGDYVELYLDGKKEILFSGNLKELELQLPATFLRVHRSYSVNIDYIQSLSSQSTRQKNVASAGGFLTLKGDYEVPVSRRIMPQVRNALK
jgi:DNA-binding LytR/AlgR family response regulator